MGGPIRPKDVAARKTASIPEEVFVVFNNLIVENWTGSSATIMQADAALAIASALEISVSDVYNRKLLDVEDAFKKAGWNVKYDKPGYNEEYSAYFVFSKKR